MKRLLLCFAALTALAVPAQAATVVNGSFETTPGFTGERTWQVFRGIEGWTVTRGNGIEVQSNRTLRGIDAYDGDKYVELDTGGRRSNARITQTIHFEPGQYELSFQYAPRTKRRGSNGIAYSFAGEVLGRVSGPTGTYQRKDWTRVSSIIKVEQAGMYDLSFAATGRQDRLGGLIDNVAISEVPVPASAFLLLGGLGAFGWVRRRKS